MDREGWETVELEIDGIGYEYQSKSRTDGFVSRWICRRCSKAEMFAPVMMRMDAIAKAKEGMRRHHAKCHQNDPWQR